jgi:hypothetical protein
MHDHLVFRTRWLPEWLHAALRECHPFAYMQGVNLTLPPPDASQCMHDVSFCATRLPDQRTEVDSCAHVFMVLPNVNG